MRKLAPVLALLISVLGVSPLLSADAHHRPGHVAPTKKPHPSTTRSPSPTPTISQTPTSTPTATVSQTPTATATPTSSGVCTQPVYTSSQNGALWSDGRYLVHNNGWNVSGYNVTQKIEVCSARSWNAIVTADNSNNDGAVKTYPNVHVDYHNWSTGYEPPLSNYPVLSSTFATSAPDTGIYNFAYDIWLNGVGNGGVDNREVMIWTDNQAQRPAGAIVASGLVIDGRTWDLWATSGNHILSFVPRTELESGTLNLRAFLDYLLSVGRIPANSTLGQIGFGVEVVSTNGQPQTFNFTDFSLRDS